MDGELIAILSSVCLRPVHCELVVPDSLSLWANSVIEMVVLLKVIWLILITDVVCSWTNAPHSVFHKVVPLPLLSTSFFPSSSSHSLLPSLLPTPFSLFPFFCLIFFASSFSFLFPFLPSLVLTLFPLHPFFFLHPLYFSPLSLSRPLSLSLHFFSRYTFFCTVMKYWFSVMYIKYQFNVVINIQNYMVISETVHL